MDVKKYIESGVLEAYLLGQLSEAEQNEVLEIVSKNSEIAEELHRIEDSLNKFALQQGTAIPKNILPEILGKIDAADSKSDTSPGTSQSSHGKLWKWLSALLLIVNLGLIVGIWQVTQKLSDNTTELSSLKTNFENLTSEHNALKEDCNTLRGDFALFNNPSNKIVPLLPASPEKEGFASVIWNQEDKSVSIASNDLAELPSQSQYQLWALKDGKPIDAGVFDPQSKVITLNTIDQADAFAITIEPRGGSVSPTLEQLLVLGEVI